MSPIDIETIRVEHWTETRDGVHKKPGLVRTQVIAEGDEETPGTYVFNHGIKDIAVNRVRPPTIVDVYVNEKTGKIEEIPGVKGKWRRFLSTEG